MTLLDTRSALLGVHPLLRADTVMLRDARGVLLTSELEKAHLDGDDAYRLLNRLRGHLDGTRTTAEICAGLTVAARDRIRALFAELLERGFLLDLDPGELEPDVLARFLDQIRYLAHLTNEPAHAFGRFRAARILLTGSGPALAAAALGLVRNGAGSVLIAAEDGPEFDLVRAEADSVVRWDPRARPDDGYDLVLACGDRGPLPAIPRTGAMLSLAARGDWVVLGPAVRAGEALGLCCAWAAVGPTDAPAAVGYTPVLARSLGATLAFEAFRLLTGISADETVAIVQHLRTLRAVTHPVAAGCPACRPDAKRSPSISATPRPPDFQTVPDRRGTTVREYAAAVHAVIADPLPPTGRVVRWSDRPALFPSFTGGLLRPLPESPPPASRPFGERGAGTRALDLDTLAWLLRASYGPRGRRLRFDSAQSNAGFSRYPLANWHRGAAGGGGLYPLRLYLVAGPNGAVAPGVHHYSTAQHAFDHIRTGDPTEAIRAAVRHPDADRTDQFLVITLRFWNNAFKYANFAYQVGTLDVGVLLGTIGALADGIDVPLRHLLWFDDEAIGSVLGLDVEDESVLAVIPLPWRSGTGKAPDPVPSLPPAEPVEISRTVQRFSWTQEVHRTTLLSGQPRPDPARPGSAPDTPGRLSGDSADVLMDRRRSSFGGLTTEQPVRRHELDQVLDLVHRTRLHDDDLRAEGAGGWTNLSVLVTRVDELAPGGYRYDGPGGGLRAAGPAPSAERWRETLAAITRRTPNYSLQQAAAVLVVSGDLDDLVDRFGPRGHRILNAAAGQVVQSCYLAAAAVRLGCGAILSLDHLVVDEALGFTGTGERALVCFLLGRENRANAEYR
ncbi:nitroreductase family protein [Amycolatopsis orientalis]|uniref:nitroreductase family protein n=1 Tax=Amycolatopsis orientalis TaxID=31958 RepID=UPI0003FE1245|nr:SagB family peptide dehydrogenase [Amycolatopsis orientalis]